MFLPGIILLWCTALTTGTMVPLCCNDFPSGALEMHTKTEATGSVIERNEQQLRHVAALIDELRSLRNRQKHAFETWQKQCTEQVQGDTGVTGDTGHPGDKGSKGDRGQWGEFGPEGGRGQPGFDGFIGQDGARGSIGPTGDIGPDGNAGDVHKVNGQKGEPGPVGPHGIPGERGDKGYQGSRGQLGDHGSPGPTGADSYCCNTQATCCSALQSTPATDFDFGLMNTVLDPVNYPLEFTAVGGSGATCQATCTCSSGVNCGLILGNDLAEVTATTTFFKSIPITTSKTVTSTAITCNADGSFQSAADPNDLSDRPGGIFRHFACYSATTILTECFPENATVSLENGDSKRMVELEIGDRIQSVDSNGEIVISPVILFLHRSVDVIERYLALKLASGKELRLSPHHLIYRFKTEIVSQINANCFNLVQYTNVSNDRVKTGRISKNAAPDCLKIQNFLNATNLWSLTETIFAYKLRVGDFVLQRNSDSDRLEAVEVFAMQEISDRGLYAPLTAEGTVIVDGVVASCYAATEYEILAHIAMAPIRWLSYLITFPVQNGLHFYVDFLTNSQFRSILNSVVLMIESVMYFK